MIRFWRRHHRPGWKIVAAPDVYGLLRWAIQRDGASRPLTMSRFSYRRICEAFAAGRRACGRTWKRRV